MNLSGSKFLTSLAMRTGKLDMSNLVIGPTELRLARRLDHTSSLVLPEPQIRPIPVTTTRRVKGTPPYREEIQRLLGMLLDVFNGIANTRYFLGVLVGDFNVEFLLESHHKFNRVQRVSSEVVDKTRIRRYLCFVHAKLIRNYLLDSFVNGTFCHMLKLLSWFSLSRYSHATRPSRRDRAGRSINSKLSHEPPGPAPASPGRRY